MPRSENFSLDEKELLVDLVENYRGIVENKRTDVVSIQTKNECWSEIENLFNVATAKHPRQARVLKIAWQNIKSKCKKYHGNKRLYRPHIGAGPAPAKDELFEKVYSIIPEQIDCLSNPFDIEIDATLDDIVTRAERPSINQDESGVQWTRTEGTTKKQEDIGVIVESREMNYVRPRKCTLTPRKQKSKEQKLLAMAKVEHELKLRLLQEEHGAKMKVAEAELARVKNNERLDAEYHSKRMKLLE